MSKVQLVCLPLVMVTASALADTQQDCAQQTHLDLRISACSDIIRHDKAAWAYVNRGVAYSDGGDQDRAIADFTTAIEIRPDDPANYNNRGVAHHCAQDYRR